MKLLLVSRKLSGDFDVFASDVTELVDYHKKLTLPCQKCWISHCCRVQTWPQNTKCLLHMRKVITYFWWNLWFLYKSLELFSFFCVFTGGQWHRPCRWWCHPLWFTARRRHRTKQQGMFQFFGHINEFVLHRAQLPLRWVTMLGFNSQCR